MIPDFFEGKPVDIKNYPPDTPEKQKLIGEFFAGPANPAAVVEKAKVSLGKVQEAYPKVEKWVIVGFCWGGKIAVTLTGGELKGVVGTVQIHPAFLDASDAEKVKIAHLALMSQDESAEAIDAYKKVFEKSGGKQIVSEYKEMHHGWYVHSGTENGRITKIDSGWVPGRSSRKRSSGSSTTKGKELICLVCIVFCY